MTAASSRDCNGIELSPDEQSVRFQMGWVRSWKYSKRLKKKPTSSKQHGKCRKCYKMLTSTEQQYHRKERKRQKPNEARWKKEQTKDLLKAAEDARDKIRMAKGGRGGVGHIQRHFCVQIGLMSLCYKSFFFLFYSSWELNRSVLFYQNIHVLNVKWI